MMSKATKGKTVPENDDLVSARWFVRCRLEQVLAKRQADVEVLRDLISQIHEASPYLVQKFAAEARHRRSRLVDKFMASVFGDFDAEGKVVPFYGNGDDVIKLDAFLSHHLTEEALRRTRDASPHEYETW